MYCAVLVSVFLLGGVVTAQSYDEWSSQLKSATDQAEVHRLKARTAQAAMDRLEEEDLSKTLQKKLKSEVSAHCSDVQLGAMDVWYGDSVVTWGRLYLLNGDWQETRAVLMSQAEVLENIEKNLAANQIPVSSISPLAGCRYLLGETYRREYEDSADLKQVVDALKQYTNVYIKYGDSAWGPKAQEKAEEMTALLESRGKHVRIELGEHRATFIKSKFSSGARLTAEGDYDEALAQYTDAINFCPESSKSAEALRNIGTCLLNLGQGEEALATVEYLCERFASDTNAPVAVLAMGRHYLDAGLEDTGEQVFDRYLSAFPEDSHRADIRSYFAWKAYKAEDWEVAIVRFHDLERTLRTIGSLGAELEKAVFIQASRPGNCASLDAFMEEFPASDLVPSALGKKAEVLLVDGHYEEAFDTLNTLSQRFPDAAPARSALSGLIVAAVDAGRFDIADQVLDRMLADKASYGLDVYLSTGRGLLNAKQYPLAEKAFAAVPANAERKFAERALYGLGQAQVGRDHFEQALETLNRLVQAFPDSGYFYEVRLMQARALVQLGRLDEALAGYREVLAGRPDPVVTCEMASLLRDPEERLATYQRIVLLGDAETDAELMADCIVASLPLCLELGKYDLAVENCKQFETCFPKHEQQSLIRSFRKEAADALAL